MEESVAEETEVTPKADEVVIEETPIVPESEEPVAHVTIEESKPLSHGKVILVTPRGCIVVVKGENVYLDGTKYTKYQIGDELDF